MIWLELAEKQLGKTVLLLEEDDEDYDNAWVCAGKTLEDLFWHAKEYLQYRKLNHVMISPLMVREITTNGYGLQLYVLMDIR